MRSIGAGQPPASCVGLARLAGPAAAAEQLADQHPDPAGALRRRPDVGHHLPRGRAPLRQLIDLAFHALTAPRR